MFPSSSPLEDVVTPIGSREGRALWHRVAAFIQGEAAADFEELALAVFRFQFGCNAVYRKWCGHLGWDARSAAACADWKEIPMLPVEAFKWDTVRAVEVAEPGEGHVFRTSGTTGASRGEHHVQTPHLYRISAIRGFERVHGPARSAGPVVLGLLPGYLERSDSSLVHMVHLLRQAGWMEDGGRPEGGFYLDEHEALFAAMEAIWAAHRKVVLIGVTWALVDAAEAWKNAGRAPVSHGLHIAVTGGMKGTREEWVPEQVRSALRNGFGGGEIGGEYGMTELLSQAWSVEGGIYRTPHWMRMRLRRTDDPFALEAEGTTGGIDVVDLANLGSCSFVSTQDLARATNSVNQEDSAFELLGRFDRSEVRGCNLMVQ